MWMKMQGSLLKGADERHILSRSANLTVKQAVVGSADKQEYQRSGKILIQAQVMW